MKTCARPAQGPYARRRPGRLLATHPALPTASGDRVLARGRRYGVVVEVEDPVVVSQVAHGDFVDRRRWAARGGSGAAGPRQWRARRW